MATYYSDSTGKVYVAVNYVAWKAVVGVGSALCGIWFFLDLYLIFLKCFQKPKSGLTMQYQGQALGNQGQALGNQGQPLGNQPMQGHEMAQTFAPAGIPGSNPNPNVIADHNDAKP